jgi:hypothetical protein
MVNMSGICISPCKEESPKIVSEGPPILPIAFMFLLLGGVLGYAAAVEQGRVGRFRINPLAADRVNRLETELQRAHQGLEQWRRYYYSSGWAAYQQARQK